MGRRMAHFNRVVTNHLTLPFAGTLPTFGIVVHTGRKSGRQYRTPVNVFHTGHDIRIALTYGSDSEWVRNVVTAGEARLITRQREYHVTHPAFVHDGSRQGVPLPMRLMLRLVGVADFLTFRVTEKSGEV
jgi:deazaflavin-dependent oxidoreductase (nitroreductase family)